MEYLKNKSIKDFSYIKVGGMVDEIFIAKNEKEIIEVIDNKSRIRIVGGGSKILFSFKQDHSSYLIDRNDFIFEKKDSLLIGGGTPLSKVGKYFENHSLKGFSALSTIPGRIGGSIVQNASCYNQCISDKLLSVTVYFNHKIIKKKKEELMFSYRNSIFKYIPYVILHAEFKKEVGNKDDIKNTTLKILEYRKNNQPINTLTLGSTFKNINGFKVGQILDELNLKGFSLSNQVNVSKIHANFLEIKKDCSYEQIMLLIHSLSGVLYKKKGIIFPLEIIIFREDYFGGEKRISWSYFR